MKDPANTVPTARAEQKIRRRQTIRGIVLQLALFGIPASLFYAWFITNGTFDFFGRERHGLAYGSLLMHMLHGSLEVDRHAVGLEGFFVGDKVYMYYGILPALLRLPFVPFVDLNTVTVSRVIVLCLAIAQAAVWHYLLLGMSKPSRLTVGKPLNAFYLLVLGAIAWLLSPSLALTANSSIFHEPIAAAVLIAALYILVVWQGLQSSDRIDATRLLVLAVLAGLSVHTRPPLALGLYGTTLVLLALNIAMGRRPQAAMRSGTRELLPFLVPVGVLVGFGLSYLGMNWIRWGNPLQSWPLEYYGYYRYVPGWKEDPALGLAGGTFNARRIMPNLVAYLTANPDWTWAARDLARSGGGRIGSPLVALAGAWPLPLAIGIAGMATLWRCRLGHRQITMNYLAVFVGLCFPALLLLAYPTITYRYQFMLWPPIALALMLGVGSVAIWHNKQESAIGITISSAIFAILIVSAYYQISSATVYKLTSSFANENSQKILQTHLIWLFPVGLNQEDMADSEMTDHVDRYERWERKLLPPEPSD